jgi:hypothetical protein
MITKKNTFSTQLHSHRMHAELLLSL